MAKETYTAIPAQPGWYVVGLLDDDKLWFDPIVAWDVCRMEIGNDSSRWALPVTLDGEYADSRIAIKSPDGRFTIPSGGSTKSESQIIEMLRKTKRPAA
jgi:hypothetical protein